MYDNTEASQAEINAAVDELLGGMLQLRFKADKTILETVIEAGGKVEGSNYTGESYAALQGALAEAEAVLADENASQEKVDAATEKVRAAIEGLAAVEGATETPSTTDKATQTGQETTTTTAAKTGDVTPIAGLAAITLAGAALLIFRKRAK